MVFTGINGVFCIEIIPAQVREGPTRQQVSDNRGYNITVSFRNNRINIYYRSSRPFADLSYNSPLFIFNIFLVFVGW